MLSTRQVVTGEWSRKKREPTCCPRGKQRSRVICIFSMTDMYILHDSILGAVSRIYRHILRKVK